MDRSEAARLLGQAPKARTVEAICPTCGRSFRTTKRGIYCSNHCRYTAANARKKNAPRDVQQ